MPTNYAEVLEQARGIIEAHNGALGDGAQPISWDDFESKLKGEGGTTVDALRQVSWEDLQALGAPRLLARQLAELFRGSKAASSGDQAAEPPRKGISAKQAPNATIDELVASYDPINPTSPAAVELKNRTGNRPFVLFDESGGVHRKYTAQLAQELVEGEPEREHFMYRDRPTTLYRIGERPPQVADEHPLRQGVALRKDGSCTIGLNWVEHIRLETRILLHLAVTQTRELIVQNSDHMREIHTRAQGDQAAAEMRVRYPNASQLYDRLDAQSKLPTLKVDRKLSTTGGGGTNDPFRVASAHRQT